MTGIIITGIRAAEYVPFLPLSPFCPGTGRVSRGTRSRRLNTNHRRNHLHFMSLWLKAAQCKQPLNRQAPNRSVSTGVRCVMRTFGGSAKLKGKEKRWVWGGDSLVSCSGFQREDELGWGEGAGRVHCYWLLECWFLTWCWCCWRSTGPSAAQVQLLQANRDAEEFIIWASSINLLGNCAIIFAEVFSLLCKNEKQLEIALSSSKYCVLPLIFFAVNFVHDFQHFSNHG